MNVKATMKKHKIVFIIVLIFIAIIILLYTTEPSLIIKTYYYRDKRDFNVIESFFKELYTEDILSTSLYNNGNLLIGYNNDSVTKNISDEQVVTSLNHLKEKYAAKGYPEIWHEDYNYNFSFINVKYDENGNMMLVIQAYIKEIDTNDKLNNPDKTDYYFIYCDSDYDKKDKKLRFDIKYAKPFSGNAQVQ